MELRIKLAYSERTKDKNLEQWYNDLLKEGELKAKISTKSINIEKDNRDERNIKGLKRVELTIPLKQGYLLLRGNLGVSFRNQFGGELYLVSCREIPNGDFKTQGGVPLNITFDNNYPDSVETMFSNLEKIAENPSFLFNIKQFDEFMEVFTFYKELSNDINNSATYNIIKSSKPYNYISVDVKDIYDNNNIILDTYSDLIAVYDSDEIIKGYKVPEVIYERFNNNLKDRTNRMVDIHIEYKQGISRRIQRMRENIYVSKHSVINDRNSKDIKDIELVNITRTKDDIILSVLHNETIKEPFLNLYDMGQKIKIESIENSLKLINGGTSEASMTMIEYLIGDRVMPSNTIKIDTNKDFVKDYSTKVKNAKDYIKGLNDSQKAAFIKAVDGSPVTLIKGPPGTGKTHVIDSITQYITKELNEKVIISSQTHVAIDNVLDKLMENHDLVIPNRITNRKNKYSIEEIDKTLYKTWGVKLPDNLLKTDNTNLSLNIIEKLKDFKGLEEIKYSDNPREDFEVIGATTTTSAISGKRGLELLKGYDWLIIDEVSKSPITEVLRYLPYVKKIILVGDDYQLSPLLEFKKDDVKHLSSYNEEMFEKLETIYEQSVFSKTIRKAEDSGRLILLDENYRSVKEVLAAYNIFYDGKLKNRREKVAKEIVQFREESVINNDKNIFFVEVLGSTEQDDSRSHSRYNVQEAAATALVLEDILKTVKSPENVTISAIFPYASQISYFTKNYRDLINTAKRKFKSFELDTVDAFQGRETDIVLVNTVVTRPEKRNFLRDFRRINVSMSRARDKLIIFGSQNLTKMEMETPDGGTTKYFKNIIDGIRKNGEIIKISQEGSVISNDRKHTSKFK